jgi:riboflavin synthase
MDLEIRSRIPLAELSVGASVAVDGCCLTVAGKTKTAFSAFLSHETLSKTTFEDAEAGAKVNLERSLRLASVLDGHLVQGHVEGVGTIHKRRAVSGCLEVEVALPIELSPFVLGKGSIAIDGISLTINFVKDKPSKKGGGIVIGVNLVPHTLKSTTLGDKVVGTKVNIETDIVGRYVYRILKQQQK